MKPQAMQADIQKAVKDYVDQLISQRSGPGKGMALSPSELMTAARAAGQVVHTQTYLKPGIELITDSVRPQEPVVKDRLTSRGGSGTRQPMPVNGYKPKKEPHWLTWRTGTTPTPQKFVTPRPPSSARPGTSASRANAVTPGLGRESPDVEILDLTSSNHKLRPASVAKPRPPSVAVSRFNTPCPDRLGTPASVRNNPTGQEFHSTANHSNGNPAYMPALKAWVDKANDYELDVANNLLQVLSTNAVPLNKPRNRPKSTVAQSSNKPGFGLRRNIPKTAGVRTTYPAVWQQIYKDPHNEQYIVNQMAKGMEREEPQMYLGPPEGYTPAAPQLRRLPYTEPVNQAPCFMNSKLPYKSSFIINPEWVSEVQPLQRFPSHPTFKPTRPQYK